MKKLLLYLTIFIGGLIGAFGWIVANVLLIRPGGVSSVLSALRSSPEGIPILLLFVVMSTSGLLLAILEVSQNHNH